jgi:MFS family permease
VTSYRLLALGSGARAVGLVAAAFALVPLFAAIPLGRFADRRGRSPSSGC